MANTGFMYCFLSCKNKILNVVYLQLENKIVNIKMLHVRKTIFKKFKREI